MRLVLADGAGSTRQMRRAWSSFRASHVALLDDPHGFAKTARADADTVCAIKRKYRLKNTTGYPSTP